MTKNERASTEDDIANGEYAKLLQEAQDACARRISAATTIGIQAFVDAHEAEAPDVVG